MDMESKLDEDFLFYLGFTSTYAQKVKDCDRSRAQQWLQKLCGEPTSTIAQKRNRNIFLSNLLLDIQDRKLTGPFVLNPDEVNFEDAAKYFPAISTEVTVPTWLNEVVEGIPPVDEERRVDGRTYVATRALPGGEGAFAYVAINMNDEPMWLGGGEGAFDKAMHSKFQEQVPPQSEMEQILARRKDPKERKRVITFYQVILQNIADELDGKIKTEDNTDVNGLMNQLVAEMKKNGEYGQYCSMDEKERRTELLLLLFDRTNARKRQTETREEILDNIGAELNTSFFQGTMQADEDKYEMPSAMWEYCINRPPGRKNMENLRIMYPAFLIERFMELLADTKEEIATRMQRRHVNIVTQMKKELKVEGEKLKKDVREIQDSSEQMEKILKEVMKAYDNQVKSYEEAANRRKGGQTELSNLYEEMVMALKETQFGVEQEAARGRFLAEQINAVNMQTEMYNKITERTIMITEEANMELIKNIRRLYGAVKQHEARLEQIKRSQENKRQIKGGGQTMFIM